MKTPRKKNPAGWLIVAAIGTAVGIGVYVFLFYIQTYHFAVVTPGVLYRMGVRDKRELETTIRRVHPKTVVCLVTDKEVDDPSEAFQTEFSVLKADGIHLVRIPIKWGGPPTQGQIDEFLNIVKDRSNQPVIVHCAEGVIRTGMMVAAYDRQVLGYNEEQALNAVQIFGKGADRGETVKHFIRQYYDQQQASAVTAATGKN